VPWTALVAAVKPQGHLGMLYANVRSVLPACPLALAGPILVTNYPIHNQSVIRVLKVDTYAGIPCRNSISAEVPNWTDQGPWRGFNVGEYKSGNEHTRIALGQCPVRPSLRTTDGFPPKIVPNYTSRLRMAFTAPCRRTLRFSDRSPNDSRPRRTRRSSVRCRPARPPGQARSSRQRAC
jgi:hypothetical protein